MSQSYPVNSAAISLKGRASSESSSDEWGPNPFKLTSDSMITEALNSLSATLDTKNSDYKMDSNEFSNFYFAADVAGISASEVMLAQIGIKIGRIKGLTADPSKDVNHESLLDTYQDLAGYAILLYALKLKEIL
jgi:hypothetical protein